MLTWRLTNFVSPAGPNFDSEREQAIAGGIGRARRASILDGPLAPTQQFMADGHHQDVGGRPRTNSSVVAEVNGDVLNNAINNVAVGGETQTEMQNARAIEVLERVQQKLTGHDFKPDEELDIISQVDKLINEAIKLENLCQHYIGWCSFW